MKLQQAQQGHEVPHPAFGPTDKEDELVAVHRSLLQHADEPGALLPILHDVQDALGYIPAHTVPVIADALNLSRARCTVSSPTTTTSVPSPRAAT